MTPPDNIGPRSTPDYASLAAKGIHSLGDGTTVFAGQRDDAFFADVGAIFDLVAIRNGTGANGGGKDFLAGYGVHSIALQIPKSHLDNGGEPHDRRLGGHRPPEGHGLARARRRDAGCRCPASATR